MAQFEELPHGFGKDTKVGDNMIVMGSHVRIYKIELVIHTRIVDDTYPDRTKWTVHIPMTDCHNPFPHEKP